MDVYGKITPLPGEDKAFAHEIDTKECRAICDQHLPYQKPSGQDC